MKSTSTLGALNAATTIPLGGGTAARIVIAGVFVATLIAEVSTDGGATWVGHPIRSGAAYVANVTAVGTVSVHDMPAGAQFRVKVSAYTSGAADVTITVS